MPKRTDISKILLLGLAFFLSGESRAQVAPKDFNYSPRPSPCSRFKLVNESNQPVRGQEVLLKKVSIYWSYLGGQKAFETKPGKMEWRGTTDQNGEVDLSAAIKQPYFLEVKGKPSARREINIAAETKHDCSSEFVLNELSKGHWLLDTKEEIATRRDILDQIEKARQQRNH